MPMQPRPVLQQKQTSRSSACSNVAYSGVMRDLLSKHVADSRMHKTAKLCKSLRCDHVETLTVMTMNSDGEVDPTECQCCDAAS